MWIPVEAIDGESGLLGLWLQGVVSHLELNSGPLEEHHALND